MKTLPPVNESSEAKALVERLVADLAPEAEAFCYVEKFFGLPTFVYEPGDAPELDREGLHLVTGDLDVPELVLRDREDRAFIFVAGDVHCRELWTSGMVFVGGALRAHRLVGQSGCNNTLVCGSLQVTELVERGHSITVIGELEKAVFYSSHGMVTSENEETQHPETPDSTVFLPELLDEEGEVDWDRWSEYAKTDRRWHR